MSKEVTCPRANCANIRDGVLCRALQTKPKQFEKCPFFKTVEQARREKAECRARIESLPVAQQAHIRDLYFGLGGEE